MTFWATIFGRNRPDSASTPHNEAQRLDFEGRTRDALQKIRSAANGVERAVEDALEAFGVSKGDGSKPH